jgi:hypothetical protein
MLRRGGIRDSRTRSHVSPADASALSKGRRHAGRRPAIRVSSGPSKQPRGAYLIEFHGLPGAGVVGAVPAGSGCGAADALRMR